MSLADELEKLAGEATPGPWVSGEYAEGSAFEITGPDEAHIASAWFDDPWPPRHYTGKVNAALIVALRNALPAILSALREREAVVAWLRSGGFTRDFGLPWRENLADAIEAGQHMN